MLTRPTGGTRPLPGDWERRGACKEVGADVMYPSDDTSQQRRAKAVCASCPVRTECLLHAIAVNEDLGTWGGLGEAPRKRIRSWMNSHPGAPLMAAVMATGTNWSASPPDTHHVVEVVDELRRMAGALA